MQHDNILEMKSISKAFSGVTVLHDVNLDIRRGEIHAIVGENGAGKSTLMNILSGVYSHGSFEGKIKFNGEECIFNSVRDSEEKGIVIIHQELTVLPNMTIAENIFLRNEWTTYKGLVIDWNKTNSEAIEHLQSAFLTDSPTTLVKDIGIGKQQLVEIAKALSKKVDLLILDEPTAALNEKDSINLLNLLLSLKEKGLSSVIISHRINEICYVADRITILRDGKTIETLSKNEQGFSEPRIIKGMVGRDLINLYPPREKNIKDTFFEVKNQCSQLKKY